MSTNPLGERHAVVTGGSRGIGLAIARRLLDAGARVTLLGRDSQTLAAAATSLAGDVRFAVADVTNAEQVRAAMSSAHAESGAVDILINNAGQARSAPLHKTDDELWQAMLAVNLTAVYHCIHAVLPGMIERDYGRIVNVSSTAGLKGYAYVGAYCAAKHGVIGLTRSLAKEVAHRNITVNAVCPGYTDTDIVRDAVSNIRSKTGRSEREAMVQLVADNPQHRLMRPEEIANAVAFLCLPGSEGMTGQSIAVAGGEIM